ncbi:NAD-dependent aldehyde dehydrogenase [Caulobacter sp. AP07]|uniref:aldehyde dehydrogenase family protein n=1 Tax=Caulobacter sp. AP07 TaxID=1144304 RepID=UPI0002720731|nr:aldehyde dehydrogenase family protein [Caulobacter sp. AP07]EJL27316.1 NAD-dependent aldehyde dehydrogenase [Caulobacter sp. AP07]
MGDHRVTTDGGAAQGGRLISIRNPSTGEVVGVCPAATVADLEAAVAAAKAAFASWSATSPAERQAACVAIAETLERHAEELAQLLTREQGKPLNGLGSRFEVGGAAAWARYNASIDLPVKMVRDDAEGRIAIHRKPVGVVGSITPWNWPLMIAVWHVVPALRAGNTVVIKPSPLTPLSTLRLVELLNQVLPPGVLTCVVGGDEIGPLLVAHRDVAKLVFTGSTSTGRKVMAGAAEGLKRLTLELGGNDAAIVLPDVDPSAIAEGLFWGAFVNNGQTCAALKRLYVHDDIYEAVCAALVAYAATVKTGDGLSEDNVLGPVQNAMQFAKVRDMVDQARARGARILVGGTPQGEGLFFPVTLIADAAEGMDIVDLEQFGPALPILRYRDIEDAIARANGLDFGLGGSIWTADLALGRALAARLECGTAWINKHGALRPDTPFGGVKSSGIGVEFGPQGLEEYTTIQVVHE